MKIVAWRSIYVLSAVTNKISYLAVNKFVIELIKSKLDATATLDKHVFLKREWSFPVLHRNEESIMRPMKNQSTNETLYLVITKPPRAVGYQRLLY